ncbi:TPA: restriction endonuclease subunit S [Providencia alcalifaciens]
MELRSGYKWTDVGFIPDDWDVKRLLNFASIATGSTPPTSDATNYGDDFLFVSPVDMGETKRITKTEKRLSPKGFSISRKFPKGSILFVCIGSTIGKCGIASENLTSNQQINAIFPSPTFSEDYLYYAMTAAAPRVRMLAGEQAVPLVNKTQFSETYIPLPPLPEQHVIAQALSDVDALLATLDQVIAKKRDLKQAAMQQLLTGKTRLPGFSGDWDEKRLDQVLTICHGKSQRDVEVSAGAFPILATGGQIGTAMRPLYDKPSVLIGRKGTINQPQYMDEPFWTVDTLFYSVIKDENSAKFLYYRFCLIDWMQYNEASGVPSLNARTIESIKIACPEPAEQAAIADVLSEMGAELSVLEARRDKTRCIKQAMMQELLTGKTRLV